MLGDQTALLLAAHAALSPIQNALQHVPLFHLVKITIHSKLLYLVLYFGLYKLS